MKKLIALTLALVLIFSALSVVSFAAEPVDISTCTVEEVKEQKHTGSAITPDLVVKTAGDEPTTLVKDTDYTVEFKNNTNYGTATYTVTGKGNYTGTKTGSFEIVPNTPVDGVDYLDTDTKSTKDIDQGYDATVTTNKTDVTKVQVSWKITDITASVSINKVWDPDTLKWIDDKNNAGTASAEAVTAEFDFVNLSSKKIGAQVTFAAEANFNPTVAYEVDDAKKDFGFKNLDTANTDATYDNEAKIEVTVTPGKDDFSGLTADATDAKYGTYTVKISDELVSVKVKYYESDEQKTKSFVVDKNTTVTIDKTNRSIQIGNNAAIVTDATKQGGAASFSLWDYDDSKVSSGKLVGDVSFSASYVG